MIILPIDFKNELSSQGCSPVIVAIFKFSGGDYAISDRIFEYSPGLFSVDLVESWGDLNKSPSADNAALGTGIHVPSMSISVVNISPDYFVSRLIGTNPLSVTVEVWNYLEGVSPGQLLDKFTVQDNLRASQRDMVVNIDLVSLMFTNDPLVGELDTVSNIYLNTVYGSVDNVPGSLYGENPFAKLSKSTTGGDTVLSTDRNLIQAGFTVPGNLTLPGILPTDAVSTFGTSSGSQEYSGCATAPNGKIYCAPHAATTVLEIDPVTRTVSTFGTVSGVSNQKYRGCATAPNGKIYCAPYSATTILEIDPVTRTVSTFGTVSGTGQYDGCAVAPNGKIYCAPHDATTVLEIDPVTRTVSTFGTVSGVNGSYRGCATAPNGKIYCAPYNSTVLEIDPVTRTVSTFGFSGTTQYDGCATAPNGKIYCAPHAATTVLEIDPVTRTVSTFGTVSGAGLYRGCAVAPNGKIYCAPYNAAVLEIDPVTRTVSTFGFISSLSYSGCATAPNGKIYCAPYSATTVLEIYTYVTYSGIDGDKFTGCHLFTGSASKDDYILKYGHDYVFAFSQGPVLNAGNFSVNGSLVKSPYQISSDTNPVTVTCYGGLPGVFDNGDVEVYLDPTLDIETSVANPALAMSAMISKNPKLTIDSVSFDTAETWYDDNGYYFNGFIPGETRVSEILLSMLKQTRSYIISNAGELFLKILGTVDPMLPEFNFLSETENNVVEDSIDISWQQYGDTVNKYNVQYAETPLEGFTGSLVVQNAGSIGAYGTLDETLQAPLVTSATMIQDVADYYLADRLEPGTIVSFTTLLEAFPLEIGDFVGILTEFCKLGQFSGRIINLSRKFADPDDVNGVDTITIIVIGYPDEPDYQGEYGFGNTPFGLFPYGF